MTAMRRSSGEPGRSAPTPSSPAEDRGSPVSDSPDAPKDAAKAAPPSGPSSSRARLVRALRRTVTEYRRDNLGDWAASLTYYGVLSIFPALLALVSIVGVLGTSAVDELIDNLGELAPGPARSLLTGALAEVRDGPGKAGVALVVAVLLALWSASGYVAGFMRAANAVYGTTEGRPTWKTLPLRLGLTLALLLLVAVSGVAVVFTGTLAKQAGGVLGVGDTAVRIWDVAKWPVLVFLVSLMFALLYWVAPDVHRPGFRWVSPGSLLAVLIWIVASAAFAFYVANFGSYNKTYGSLAAAIVFLVWLWITNSAILLGLEFNAELDRAGEGDREGAGTAEGSG